MELLEIDRATRGRPAAPVMGEYEPDLVPGQTLRDDIKPLHITQPEGVSFEVDGTEVRWQNWSFRLGFNYREGPVIYQVALRRPRHHAGHRLPHVLRRDDRALPGFQLRPLPAHGLRHRRVGPGLHDPVARARLRLPRRDPLSRCGSHRQPRASRSPCRNAICLHEEDNAVLWKHVDSVNGRAEVRRARRIVVSMHATVANYEYLVYWRFYQDGNIECEVRATGIMVTTPFAEGAEPPPTGHAGRPPHLRAVPPALPGRPAGPGRRRRTEHGAGDRLRAPHRSVRTTPTVSR